MPVQEDVFCTLQNTVVYFDLAVVVWFSVEMFLKVSETDVHVYFNKYTQCINLLFYGIEKNYFCLLLDILHWEYQYMHSLNSITYMHCYLLYCIGDSSWVLCAQEILSQRLIQLDRFPHNCRHLYSSSGLLHQPTVSHYCVYSCINQPLCVFIGRELV